MGSLIRGMVTFLSRLRSGAIDLTNSRYERRVDEINRRHKDVSGLSDAALQGQAAAIRQRVHSGMRLDSVVNDAFAIVKRCTMAQRSVISPPSCAASPPALMNSFSSLPGKPQSCVSRMNS